MDTQPAAGPVVPGTPWAAHQPLATPPRLDGGRLGDWQDRNRTATIPHLIAQLEIAGTLDNFRRLADNTPGRYKGFVFADSDLYKTIEAIAWESGRSGATEFDGWLDEVIPLIRRVQEPDGYVHTWIQGVHPEKRFAELEWTHEMYVMGHLIQAAVALARCTGRTDLLDVARRVAGLLVTTFGPTGRLGVCGHPEIEMALVELYRLTGDAAYRDLARSMIDRRGRGLLPVGDFGARYFQDHTPVRTSRTATGHAVRQLYLNSGATDVYLETGDAALLAAMDAQWDSAHHRKMYLTGAFGSRPADEAFGDDYELPPDRAYAESCATVADLQWSWRMLLAGGAAGTRAYAETIEREIHNGLAASVSADGTSFFYSNPLQRRPDAYSQGNARTNRQSWYPCACCPPNIARTVAQFHHYLATTTRDALWIHQWAGATVPLPPGLGGGTVTIRTDYPASGAIAITVTGEPRPDTWLGVRIPTWSPGSVVRGPGGSYAAGPDGYARVPLAAGTYALDLDLTPRFTYPHHRVDAVRGQVALEVGPLVHCVEQRDVPAGIELDDLVVDVAAGAATTLTCHVAGDESALYTPRTTPAQSPTYAVPTRPYATWGNHGQGAMRVWLPAGMTQAG